jgi:hypothetical protein
MPADWLVRDDLRARTVVEAMGDYEVNRGHMDAAMYALYKSKRRGSTKSRRLSRCYAII